MLSYGTIALILHLVLDKVQGSRFYHGGMQWGSEICTSLDFEWSKRGWVANVPDFQRDLKSGQMADILSKTI